MSETAGEIGYAKICPQCGSGFSSTDNVCAYDGSTLQFNDNDPFLGKKVAGRYTMLALLGFGSWGNVYKAYDEQMARPVAIKVLHAHLSAISAQQKRFRRELETVCSLSHPNIVTVYDTAVIGRDQPCLVMEYLDGTPLDGILDSEDRLPVKRAINIFVQVCHALSAAHAKGIVHRDIKPSNIMVMADDTVKVLDFGLSKAASEGGERLSATGEIFGTLPYMSPEQCKGEHIDGRSDIYSLGCSLFEALSGRRMCEASTAYECMVFHMQETVPSLSEIRSDILIPPGLEEIVNKAIAKDPRDRFFTADEFAAALEAYQTTGRTQLRRRRQSNKTLAGWIAGSVLSVALAAGGWIVYKEGNHHRHQPGNKQPPVVAQEQPAAVMPTTRPYVLPPRFDSLPKPELELETDPEFEVEPGYTIASMNRKHPPATEVESHEKHASATAGTSDKRPAAKAVTLAAPSWPSNIESDIPVRTAVDPKSKTRLTIAATPTSAPPVTQDLTLRTLKTYVAPKDVDEAGLISQLAQLDPDLCKTIHLNGSHAGDKTVDFICAHLPNIKVLSVNGTNIDDRAMYKISCLPQLTALLAMNVPNVTATGWNNLTSMSTLTGLAIGDNRLTDEDLAFVPKLPLNALTIAAGDRLTAGFLKSLQQIPNLRTLRFLRASFSDNEMANACTDLQLFNFVLGGNDYNDHTLNIVVVPQKRLRTLTIASNAVTPDGIAALAQLPQLRVLDIQHTRLGDGVVDVLCNFPSLRQVKLPPTALTSDAELKLAARGIKINQ